MINLRFSKEQCKEFIKNILVEEPQFISRFNDIAKYLEVPIDDLAFATPLVETENKPNDIVDYFKDIEYFEVLSDYSETIGNKINLGEITYVKLENVRFVTIQQGNWLQVYINPYDFSLSEQDKANIFQMVMDYETGYHLLSKSTPKWCDIKTELIAFEKSKKLSVRGFLIKAYKRFCTEPGFDYNKWYEEFRLRDSFDIMDFLI